MDRNICEARGMMRMGKRIWYGIGVLLCTALPLLSSVHDPVANPLRSQREKAVKYKGQKGKRGPMGPKGDRGPAGPAGAPAPVEPKAFGSMWVAQSPGTTTPLKSGMVIPLKFTDLTTNYQVGIDIFNSRLRIKRDGIYTIRFHFKAYAKPTDPAVSKNQELELILRRISWNKMRAIKTYRLVPIPIHGGPDGYTCLLTQSGEQTSDLYEDDELELVVASIKPEDAQLNAALYVPENGPEEIMVHLSVHRIANFPLDW